MSGATFDYNDQCGLDNRAGMWKTGALSSDFAFRSPNYDSCAVNRESKGLSRFNAESPPGLKAVNPGSTQGLSVSTLGLGHQPGHPGQKHEGPQRETPAAAKLKPY